MVSERDTYLDADDTTVSVTQSLLDAQAPSHNDGEDEVEEKEDKRRSR